MSRSTQDVHKQVIDALDPVRAPLLAVLGAGSLVGQAVNDALTKARDQVQEGTESARKSFDELPSDFDGVRERLDPAELRKAVDEYTESLQKLYSKLTEAGEEAWDKILAQPQVKRAVEQLEDALANVEGRVDDVTSEGRERFDDALGPLTRRTRSVGERTATTVKKVADETAEKVQDVGDDVAHETRSASRKAANKTAPKAATGSTAAKSSGAAGSTAGKSTGATAAKSTGTAGSTGAASTGSNGTKGTKQS